MTRKGKAALGKKRSLKLVPQGLQAAEMCFVKGKVKACRNNETKAQLGPNGFRHENMTRQNGTLVREKKVKDLHFNRSKEEEEYVTKFDLISPQRHVNQSVNILS